MMFPGMIPPTPPAAAAAAAQNQNPGSSNNPNPRKRDAPGADPNEEAGIGILQPHAAAAVLQQETAQAAAVAAASALGPEDQEQVAAVAEAVAGLADQQQQEQAQGGDPSKNDNNNDDKMNSNKKSRMKRLLAHEVMEKFKDKGFKLSMQGEEQVVICECNHKVQSGKQARDIMRHIESVKHVHYLKNRHNMKPFEVRNNKMRPLPPKEVMQKFRGQPGFKIVVRNGQEICICLCNGKIQSNKQATDIQRHIQTNKHQSFVRSVKPPTADDANQANLPPKKLTAQDVFLHNATDTLNSLAKCLELNPESISMRDRDAFATAMHRAQEAISKCP